MTNHPNRYKRRPSPARNPSPEEIIEARTRAGLTQSQAAARIYVTLRAWRLWEAGDRKMHPAFWELLKIKTM